MDSKSIKYIILTIILLILSVFGLFLIFKINPQPLNLVLLKTKSFPTPTPIPISESISPTETPEIKITPESTDEATTITKTPTPTPIPSSNSTANQLIFHSIEDNFAVRYSNSRKVYQDKESNGNRYTFYLGSGNFAIHTTSSGTWSWTNTSRNFSSTFTVSGQNTFRYDISTQTIVDLQSPTKNYTIQCVHNGIVALKTECETFIQSFQLQ